MKIARRVWRDLCSARPAFDSVAYWDGRHTHSTQPFEWYLTSSRALAKALVAHEHGASCLEVGCGTSALGVGLENRGFQVQYCDFSAAAINFWRRRRPAASARYHVADVRMLPFADSSFAFAVDKGCLDALAFGKAGATDPARELAPALAELARVLRPTGVLYSFSTDPPELRVDALRDASALCRRWTVHWTEIDEEDALPITDAQSEHAARISAPTPLASLQGCSYFLYSLRRLQRAET